jgi:hypothetical protein
MRFCVLECHQDKQFELEIIEHINSVSELYSKQLDMLGKMSSKLSVIERKAKNENVRKCVLDLSDKSQWDPPIKNDLVFHFYDLNGMTPAEPAIAGDLGTVTKGSKVEDTPTPLDDVLNLPANLVSAVPLVGEPIGKALEAIGGGIEEGVDWAGRQISHVLGDGAFGHAIEKGIGAVGGFFGGLFGHHHKRKVHGLLINRQQIDDLTRTSQRHLDQAKDLKQEKAARLNDLESKCQNYTQNFASVLRFVQNTQAAMGSNLKN